MEPCVLTMPMQMSIPHIPAYSDEMLYCEEKKQIPWLRYLFACCFLLTCAAFITFLVLFIIAVSGGMGKNAGRMILAEETSPMFFNKLYNNFKNYDFFKKVN